MRGSETLLQKDGTNGGMTAGSEAASECFFTTADQSMGLTWALALFSSTRTTSDAPSSSLSGNSLAAPTSSQEEATEETSQSAHASGSAGQSHACPGIGWKERAWEVLFALTGVSFSELQTSQRGSSSWFTNVQAAHCHHDCNFSSTLDWSTSSLPISESTGKGMPFDLEYPFGFFPPHP